MDPPWLPQAVVRTCNSASNVSVSAALWSVLNSAVPSASSSKSKNVNNNKLALSFGLPRITTKHSSKKQHLFTAYACLNDESNDENYLVYIPGDQAQNYGLVDSDIITVTLSKPVQLSQVFLLSMSPQTYSLSQSTQNTHQNQILQQLCSPDRIIRQGDHVSLSLSTSADNKEDVHAFQILMCEPVLEGVCNINLTRFLVLPPHHRAPLTPKSSPPQPHSTSLPSNQIQQSLEQLEIDETFLAPSLAPSIKHQNRQAFYLQRLTSPISQHSVLPKPPQNEDSQLQAFALPAHLARHGLSSGDWISLTLNSKSQQSHPLPILLRVYALPWTSPQYHQLNNKSNSSNNTHCNLFLSPITFHNLVQKSPTCPDHSVTLHPIRYLRPHFPTASSVTLARVASPHSLQKQYQSLFLAALRTYFQSNKRRIFRLGDILAIPIDEFLGRWSHEESEPILSLPGLQSPKERLVYFKVISLQVSSDNSTNNNNNNTLGNSSESEDDNLDVKERMASGYFGAIVDPSITKMVQSGVEHARPPIGLTCNSSDHDDDQTSNEQEESDGPLKTLINYLKAPLASTSGDVLRDVQLSVLIKGSKGSGKQTLATKAANAASIHLLQVDAFTLLSETDAKTEGQLRATFDRATSCTPCVLLLKNIDALARKSQIVETGQEPALTFALQECLEQARNAFHTTGYPCFVIGTTSDPDKISFGITSAFKQEISLEAPNEAARLSILKDLTKHDNLAPDVSLRSISIQTAALVASDLVDLVIRARVTALHRARESITTNNQESVSESESDSDEVSITNLYQAGMCLTSADFNEALDKARSSYSESIGAPKIPNVTWDDVGGLASVKSDILDTIQLPLEHPELFADGLKKRSGILLYGPPGTGKTLLAKAVATSCSLNFFSVKGPELLNMYIGESEANVRRVFEKARDAKPCVIFFDELDSVAPKRGNQGDSGGVMDRIVSQLLAELDGMASGQSGADVFVIGATNRPDLLDPALLRPGRFDRMLYLGVSDTHDSQQKILEASTRKFKCDPDVDLKALSEMCPFNFTGADFYALCSDAMLKAMSRKAFEVDQSVDEYNKRDSTKVPITPQYYLAELAKPSEIQVVVKQRDFVQSLNELVPSVSKAEMDHYALVQKRFGAGISAQSEQKPSKTASSTEKQEEKQPINTNSINTNGNHINGNGNGKLKINGEQNGTVIGNLEKKKPVNGVHNYNHDGPNGFNNEDEDDDDVVVYRTKKDKGKGRATD